MALTVVTSVDRQNFHEFILLTQKCLIRDSFLGFLLKLASKRLAKCPE